MTTEISDSEDAYWSPICRLRSELNFWVRMIWREGSSIQEGYWGMLLTIPVKGYLEGPGGPIPLCHVERVEVSTNRIMGGLAGRPLQLIDVKDEILLGLKGTRAIWTLQDGTWTKERLFADQPVQLIRIANPFQVKPKA